MPALNAKALAVVVLLVTNSSAGALSIQFDYQFDASGFFGAERREVLEHAAGFFSPFQDHLASIEPGSGNSWTVSIPNPSRFTELVELHDQTIAEDTIRIYVGASPSAPSALGIAFSGFDLTVDGTDLFANAVNHRGQPGASAPTPSDYGTWGGSIWFNSGVDWFAGIDRSGQLPTQSDLLTTAVHEIAHILGFGSAESWFAQTSDDDTLFQGKNAVASFGGDVPLDRFGSHFAEGTMSVINGAIQETLMDPSTPRGERQYLTDLDYAALADIGWEVPAVPIPASLWLLSSAATLLVLLKPRRRRAFGS
ncbi:MAG: PEP-CTERM sorting domain-containing protein [Pseudomonadota bacterium]